jgi:perosamine synthetase
MLVTDDKALHDRAYKLKTQAVDKNKTYWHDELGYNYRMTNLQAALGLSQLNRLGEILMKKANIVKWYRQLLRLRLQGNIGVHSNWMIGVNFDQDAKPIADKLTTLGVETRPLFYPATEMPIYYDQSGAISRPTARTINKQCLMLPSYPRLEWSDVKEISERIKEALK